MRCRPERGRDDPLTVDSRIEVAVDDGVSLSVIPWRLDGPLAPVVLVHGLASNAHLWDGVAPDLAERGHPVVAVDLRGHGRSSKPDSGYDFETVARDLYRSIERFGWLGRPPIVAGQSWGGNVVLELAARHSHAVRAVVLVDGGTIEMSARFADWPTAEAALAPPQLAGTQRAQLEQWFRANHPDWPETGIRGSLANMEELEDGTVRPWLSRDRHMQIVRHLWDHHPGEVYPQVSVPAVMIMADDRSNPRWMAGKREEVTVALNGLPQGTVHWVDGDHDLHAQHPALVAELIHGVTA